MENLTQCYIEQVINIINILLIYFQVAENFIIMNRYATKLLFLQIKSLISYHPFLLQKQYSLLTK